VRYAPPVTRSVAWTAAQGVLLDVCTAALAGFGVGQALGRGSTGAALGAAVGGAWALRWRRPLRAALAVERARPGLGSALEAYLEGQGGTLRPRLEAWVVARVGPVWLRGGFALLGGAALLALGALALPKLSTPPVSPAAATAEVTLSVAASLQPPAYTGWAAAEVKPPLVRGLRGSTVRLEVHTTARQLRWAEQDGAERELPLASGRAVLTLPLERSGGIRLSTPEGGPVLLLALEAVADAPPVVTLEAPEGDRSTATPPGRLGLRASATDDVAVTGLGFHWTLAQGQGEAMRFRSGALSGRVTLHGQEAEASGSLEPLALGMKPGDTLVVWAEASDGNAVDGPGRGRSAVRLLRWEESVVDFSALATGGRLPALTSRLTERELLARTARLVRAGVRGAARRSKSAELADEQRQIREGFAFFLEAGREESLRLDVEDAELQESGDARARKLLAQAVSAMWAAEAELAVGNPAGALAPEAAAVKALDAALGTERVALRALRPPDKPVDERRRLSGRQSELRPRPLDARTSPPPDTGAVERLARRLLLAGEQELTAEGWRALADAVWALPAASGLPVATLAAPLYAAKDAPARSAAARAASTALARWLRPSPEVVSPASSEEGAVLARLPPPPPPPPP
jgi:hypothetical protein